ncbi:hypothetical protein RZN05_19195 [Sphingomonas sp. HF-S4]|uniref:Peptidylprolyl isomerase n=1 Tax=Sphingomonas agrestis TaxID=3080540 RepID=A0ABU3YCR2_9SPHN|nr:hypothetical protein [Sphingomonas sp. HF-S4]MDV3459131.1 hypothetical protein [Sphingomonas sp. HF-S4]
MALGDLVPVADSPGYFTVELEEGQASEALPRAEAEARSEELKDVAFRTAQQQAAWQAIQRGRGL